MRDTSDCSGLGVDLTSFCSDESFDEVRNYTFKMKRDSWDIEVGLHSDLIHCNLPVGDFRGKRMGLNGQHLLRQELLLCLHNLELLSQVAVRFL